MNPLHFLTHHFKLLIGAGFSFIIYACASVSAPDGGPEDITPPKLTSTNPEAGSLHFEGGLVTLNFSEYIDEKSLLNAVTISPKIDPEIDAIYDDDAILLQFPEDLLPDQTYVISINRNLKDERRVPLEQSIQIAFSTGDVIDEGMIFGQVHGDESYAVHLWKSSNTFSDSIFFTDPQYVSEANDSGHFEFKYLAPGDYVMLAVERSASGAKLVPERMAYGVGTQATYTIGINETVSGIPFRTRRESPPLKLTHGEWVGQKWGWMHFNQELDSATVKDLVITDVNENSIRPTIHQDLDDKKRFLIIADDTLAAGRAALTLGEVKSGNQTLTDGKISFRVSAKRDTSHTKKVSPDGSASIRLQSDGGPIIPIRFSKPIISVSDSAFIMVADTDTVVVNLDWANPVTALFIPPNGWAEKMKYKLKISSEKLIPIEGKSLKDSITWVTINSEKKMGYGGLNGQFERPGMITVIQLTSMEKEPEIFHSGVNSKYQFQFQNIPEGPYRLMIIDDVDQSGAYTFGKASPFLPSEWFYVHPDTFEVRANWDIDVGSIRVGEQ